MGTARSTHYREPRGPADETIQVEAMRAIKDEFEAYGTWRIWTALRHMGRVAAFGSNDDVV